MLLVFMSPLPSSPRWAMCLVSGLTLRYYAAGTGSIELPAIFAAGLPAAGQAGPVRPLPSVAPVARVI